MISHNNKKTDLAQSRRASAVRFSAADRLRRTEQ